MMFKAKNSNNLLQSFNFRWQVSDHGLDNSVQTREATLTSQINMESV